MFYEIEILNLQDLLMKSTMDAMFKVGFGLDLDTLSGSDETSNQFIKAFDDSNVIVYWRFVDAFWKVKRFLNIGLERNLKANLKVIDDFIYKLIHQKREQMRNKEVSTSKNNLPIIFFPCLFNCSSFFLFITFLSFIVL